MDDQIFTIAASVHLYAGIVALGAALVAMSVKKAGSIHRRSGWLYLLALVVWFPATLLRSYENGEVLPAALALLAIHLALGGHRSLHLKRLHQGQRPQRPDIIAQGVAGLLYMGMFLWGLTGLLLGHFSKDGMVFLCFGGLGLLIVFLQFNRFYKRSHDKHGWLYGHVFGMVMSFCTLLATLGLIHLDLPKHLPMWLAFPILLGPAVLIYWYRFLGRRLTQGKRASQYYRLKIK